MIFYGPRTCHPLAASEAPASRSRAEDTGVDAGRKFLPGGAGAAVTNRMTAPSAVTVIGEALIDLVPGTDERTFVAAPGGSPYNVAIGLARLGVATSLMARLADNAFGRILRERAAAEGVNLA